MCVFDNRECSICYTRITRHRKLCVTCDVALCESCWIDKCRMYCPICERGSLNAKRMCCKCRDDMHVKDVEMCCVCGSYVCYNCLGEAVRDDLSASSCDDVISGVDDVDVVVPSPSTCELPRIVAAAFTSPETGCVPAFRVIARIPIHENYLWFFKSNYKTLSIMLEGDPLATRWIASHLDMHIVEFDTKMSACIASRSFDVRAESDDIYDIFHRLPQFRQ